MIIFPEYDFMKIRQMLTYDCRDREHFEGGVSGLVEALFE